MILQWLKKLITSGGPLIIENSFFGKMTYIDDFWECKRDFRPVNKNIIVIVNANENGPDDNHTYFYRKIETCYNEIIEKCKTVLVDEYKNWCKKPFPEKFDDEFILVGLTVPEKGNENNDWNIFFDCKSDLDHQFTVYFKNGVATNVTVDG